MRLASQHVLSVSRILLGAVVLAELAEVSSSRLVLPAVVAACLADYADGKVARASGTAGDGGRLVDNLCDASFLALAFAGFALAGTWSLPLIGTATRIWRHANWLPLLALAGSFGTYMARWAASRRFGSLPVSSPAGHAAGIANYVLALVGGVAVLPGVKLPPALLETALFLIVLLNLRAVVENLRLMRALRQV
jgi:phosphatidylglycerophosphate synthase